MGKKKGRAIPPPPIAGEENTMQEEKQVESELQEEEKTQEDTVPVSMYNKLLADLEALKKQKPGQEDEERIFIPLNKKKAGPNKRKFRLRRIPRSKKHVVGVEGQSFRIANMDEVIYSFFQKNFVGEKDFPEKKLEDNENILMVTDDVAKRLENHPKFVEVW